MPSDSELTKQKYADIESEMDSVRSLWIICNSVVLAYILILLVAVLFQRGVFSKCCNVSDAPNYKYF